MDKMTAVYLCSGGKCCPAVDVSEDSVKIGEEGNSCTLTKEQWNTLKEKVRAGEL